jgi:hypothetical protein
MSITSTITSGPAIAPIFHYGLYAIGIGIVGGIALVIYKRIQVSKQPQGNQQQNSYEFEQGQAYTPGLESQIQALNMQGFMLNKGDKVVTNTNMRQPAGGDEPVIRRGAKPSDSDNQIPRGYSALVLKTEVAERVKAASIMYKIPVDKLVEQMLKEWLAGDEGVPQQPQGGQGLSGKAGDYLRGKFQEFQGGGGVWGNR